MSAMTDTISKIRCVSVKLGQASLDLLEALTIPEKQRADTLSRLKEHLQVQELLYVATCNRVEFLVVMAGAFSDVADVRNRLLDFYFKGNDSRKIDFEPISFRLFAGREAIRHIFEVAASLDSIVIGESQILGQLKAAQQYCQNLGLMGPIIERLLAASFRGAKKVRSETDLGKKSVSMASLAQIRLDEILKEKPEAVIAIVGSGPMTPKMADIIRRNHSNRILFVNRTVSKVEEYAARFGGEAVSLDKFLSRTESFGGDVPKVDIIISSTSSPEPIFDRATLERIGAGRMLAFDLAIPRDFCESLTDSEKIEVWNLERLNMLAQKNRRERFRVIDQASRILDEQIKFHLQKEVAQMITPLFDSALDESMALAQEGLSSLFESKLSHLSESDRQLLAHWSKKVLSHACYLPARQLARRIAESDSERDNNLGLLLKGAQ
jgi:glutamyl-tRNA reductase